MISATIRGTSSAGVRPLTVEAAPRRDVGAGAPHNMSVGFSETSEPRGDCGGRSPDSFISARACAGILLLCGLVTVLGCSAQRREIILSCDYGSRLRDIYALDLQTVSVRLMSVSPPRPGFLKLTDSAYSLEFPENRPSAGYMQLRVEINRFTSKAQREIGREQTVTYQGETLKLEAVRDSGDCVPLAGAVF
jgi:hypothetical protein